MTYVVFPMARLVMLATTRGQGLENMWKISKNLIKILEKYLRISILGLDNKKKVAMFIQHDNQFDTNFTLIRNRAR